MGSREIVALEEADKERRMAYIRVKRVNGRRVEITDGVSVIGTIDYPHIESRLEVLVVRHVRPVNWLTRSGSQVILKQRVVECSMEEALLGFQREWIDRCYLSWQYLKSIWPT